MSPELTPLRLPTDLAGVEVWLTELAVDPARQAVLAGWLDVGERARADRFRFARDRRRFVAARGQLRELLGDRLGTSPAAVRFRVGPHGKPALAGDDPGGWRFNVSHSGDRALLALANDGREIGVDLESAARLGDARDLPGLAARTLAPSDLARWHSFSEPERPAAFLCAWTRLEAYGKATGGGLGNVLGKVSLDRWPDVAPGWRGWDLPVGAGWGAALVVGSSPG